MKWTIFNKVPKVEEVKTRPVFTTVPQVEENIRRPVFNTAPKGGGRILRWPILNTVLQGRGG